MEQHLDQNGADGLSLLGNISEEYLDIYLKIFLLLYADDRVLMSESVEGMQAMLDIFHDYCNTWKLHVNVAKTKLVVFTKRRCNDNVVLTFNGNILEVCESYTYLGILFNFNNSFVNAKKRLVEQAQKALYSVYFKIRNLNLPIDLQLKTFDTLVKPILLYSCEVIGFDKNDNIEKVHLQFLKRIIRVRTTAQNYLVYGELGRYPLDIDVKCRMITFWNRLVSSKTLPSKIYESLSRHYMYEENSFKWMKFIKSILNDTRFSLLFTENIHVIMNGLKYM